jgi:hypothetical protein
MECSPESSRCYSVCSVESSNKYTIQVGINYFSQLSYLDHPVDVGLGPAVGRLAGQLEGSTLLHRLGDGRLLLEVVEDRLAYEHGVGGGGAPLILREADVLSCNQKAIFKPGLRFRIHFIRIQIRIQHLRLNTDPDPDPDPIRIQAFDDQKLKKIYS